MTKSNQFILSVAEPRLNESKRQPWEKEKNLESIATVSSDTLHTQLYKRTLVSRYFCTLAGRWVNPPFFFLFTFPLFLFRVIFF